MAGAPNRSTLAYANQHRPWQLYQTVVHQLLARCQQQAYAQRRKFRFKHKLLSLDGTMIGLCLSMFDWAAHKRAKGAVKLHLVLDHDGDLPCYAVLTDGMGSEVDVAKSFPFPPGTMLVFDRGYLKHLQMCSTYGWSVSNLVALLRQQLFVYRDLMTWLNDPFQAPPALAEIHDGQMTLAFA